MSNDRDAIPTLFDEPQKMGKKRSGNGRAQLVEHFQMLGRRRRKTFKGRLSGEESFDRSSHTRSLSQAACRFDARRTNRGEPNVL